MYNQAKPEDVEKFEAEQQKFATVVEPLLEPELNLQDSDEDIGFIRDEASVIEESVNAIEGSQDDAIEIYRHLHDGIQVHREMYFRDPSPEQLAAVGGIVSGFGDFMSNNPRAIKSKKIIEESLENVGTDSSVISVIPQFLTLTALVPLLTISYQFCHSVGTRPVDKMTVYELDEQVGYNPYGVPEGTSINGLYDGELSNTNRFTDSAEAADGTVATFTATLDFPIRKGLLKLWVNKRLVAIDNGSGAFSPIGDGSIATGVQVSISSQTINYWNGSNAVISVTFGAAIPSGLKVWFEHDTDVENHPDMVSETKYDTLSFDLYSTANIIRTGLSLPAILKGMRNLKVDMKSIGFSRLLAIVIADKDREILRKIARMAEGSKTFDKKLAMSGVAAEYQWARIREQMIEAQNMMAKRTDGKAGIHAWVVDDSIKELFEKMGKRYMKMSPAAANPEIANQPYFVGEFDDRWRIFYNPGNAQNVGYAIGKGKNISNGAAVLGTVTPPMPHVHGETGDLAKRCTLYCEDFNTVIPEAYKYVLQLLLTDST